MSKYSILAITPVWDLIETWVFREDIDDIIVDDNNNNNNDKGISALGLDRDMGFSRGHQGRQGHQ